LVGLTISAVFLYFAFRGQDFGEIRQAIVETNLWWLPLALALYFTGVWIRAIRWQVLLKPVTDAPTVRDLFPIVVVGFMANNILPLRAGELVRSLLLGRKHNVRKTSALATIAVERIFDGLTMLGFLALSTIFISLTSELRHLALIAFILFAGLLIGLFLLTFAGTLFDRLLQLVLGPLPESVADRIERMMASFLGGLGTLRNRGDLVKIAGTSVLAWLFEGSMYYVLAVAFGGTVREVMGVSATLLTTAVANLSTLIPGAPGYVGQFEYGVKLVLNGVMNVGEGQALAYAILVHAALYFPVTVLGVIVWFRQELSMSQLREADADSRSDAPLTTSPEFIPDRM
jgi:uncharacterized protein (TIRG00374 family)